MSHIPSENNLKHGHNAEVIRFRRVTFRRADVITDSDMTLESVMLERPTMWTEFRHFMWRMALHNRARRRFSRQLYFATTVRHT